MAPLPAHGTLGKTGGLLHPFIGLLASFSLKCLPKADTAMYRCWTIIRCPSPSSQSESIPSKVAPEPHLAKVSSAPSALACMASFVLGVNRSCRGPDTQTLNANAILGPSIMNSVPQSKCLTVAA